MDAIRAMTAQFDTYISTEIGQNMIAEIAGQMVGVVALAALVIVGVLLFTSRSYFEVVIFLVVFSVAALLNMGTNFWLGEISSITNSIAVIMQLALEIDYAIIFSHRYQDETERTEYLWPAIGGGAAVIAAAGAYLMLRRKKKRPAPAESGEQAE